MASNISVPHHDRRPHAICIPFPTQGHINPMLNLAKILHHRGFHITFVNTEFNHNRLLKSRGPNALNGLPSFQFKTIHDGLSPSNVDATQDIPSLSVSTSTYCIGPFRELIAKLNNTGHSGVPPVSCIVSDGCMTFTLDAAEELGLPEVLLWTASACGYLGYMHYRDLDQKGLTPFRDESYLTKEYWEKTVDWITGMKEIPLRYLPTSFRTTNPEDTMFNFTLQVTARAQKASAIVLNTYYQLENQAINALSSILSPPIYSIGPLQLLQEQEKDGGLAVLGSNLWKDEPGCQEWLDTKDPKSVIYANFGSIIALSRDQLLEVAWGLANSKFTFLWIIRPDLVSGDSAVLPSDFLEETKNRGMLASWCPQEHVLKHPAIGGFLTHSGWNSTLESISSGVPMICLPFYAEQPTNCWYCCTQLGVGLEIDSNVKRDEVERLIIELMVGVKGKEMEKNALKWKTEAQEAVTIPGGSSFLNLEKMIKVLRSQ